MMAGGIVRLFFARPFCEALVGFIVCEHPVNAGSCLRCSWREETLLNLKADFSSPQQINSWQEEAIKNGLTQKRQIVGPAFFVLL